MSTDADQYKASGQKTLFTEIYVENNPTVPSVVYLNRNVNNAFIKYINIYIPQTWPDIHLQFDFFEVLRTENRVTYLGQTLYLQVCHNKKKVYDGHKRAVVSWHRQGHRVVEGAQAWINPHKIYQISGWPGYSVGWTLRVWELSIISQVFKNSWGEWWLVVVKSLQYRFLDQGHWVKVNLKQVKDLAW